MEQWTYLILCSTYASCTHTPINTRNGAILKSHIQNVSFKIVARNQLITTNIL